jgi:uncharacterized protein
MKNILILHGSHGSPDRNWYPYIKAEGEKIGYVVNIPKMQFVEDLNIEQTSKKLISQGLINKDTVLIAHSSGAGVALGILQFLPKDISVLKTIFVAGFYNSNLNKELLKYISVDVYNSFFNIVWDWKKNKKSSRSFVEVYSDNDPYVPQSQALELNGKLGGNLIMIRNANHFSVNTGGERFKEFPEIVKYI